jgi:hypothetical protein
MLTQLQAAAGRVSVPEPSAWVNDTTTRSGRTLPGGVVEKARPWGAFVVTGTVMSSKMVELPFGASQWNVTWLSFTCRQAAVVLSPTAQATV